VVAILTKKESGVLLAGRVEVADDGAPRRGVMDLARV
jgi:hypothetical protein